MEFGGGPITYFNVYSPIPHSRCGRIHVIFALKWGSFSTRY